MLGVILAAGRGLRMGHLTDSRPKCLLDVGGRTILDHTIENLRESGCSEIIIVVGYQAKMIKVSGVRYVINADYQENNILHSLMKARDYLDGPVIVSYSDIWVEPWIYQRLVETPGDIVLAVDDDWQPYYEGRTEHPVSEAENVYFDHIGSVRCLGKHLDPHQTGRLTCGEFIGLWYMSASGTARFCAEFARLDALLAEDSPFQHSPNWIKAYVTDMMQELVDRGQPVGCSVFQRGWAELDTMQDYERLSQIASRQLLTTLAKAKQTS